MKPITDDAFDAAIPSLKCIEDGPRRIEDLFVGSHNSLTFQPGRSIVIEGDPIEHLYQVVAGTVRCCSFTKDGRRQIFRFARSGDLLGFVDPEVWHFSAEAVDSVVVRSIPISRLESALDDSADLRRNLRTHVAAILAERERQLSILAFEPANQRLLWFLQRYSRQRGGNGFLRIAMTRQEIGDFLGLSLETVSRSFSALRCAGMIEMKGADRFRLADAPQELAA